MNSASLVLQRVRANPRRAALWSPGAPIVTFGDLATLAARAQRMLRRADVKAGDAVLVMDPPGARLYAVILAATALGATVVLVEPWMPIARIDRVLAAVRPKLFATGWRGSLWGVRAHGVRTIPAWRSLAAVSMEDPSDGVRVESVAPETPAIVVFTSGTTGEPKGVVRTHRYLVDEHRVLSANLALDRYDGPDLCIFANFVLANLASGRTSLLVPTRWPPSALRAIADLPEPLTPDTLTAGPAFLLALLREARVPPLRAIHVGGAQTDCAIHERILARWPDARAVHLYGSSECEPVAKRDLATAVRASRARGLFQTLSLGEPVPEIRADVRADGALWVAGPHVCPMYVGAPEENRLHKRRDDDGTVWHAMGDRVAVDAEGWWLRGRITQPAEDFDLEQRVYAFLASSKSFVHREADGRRVLVGEGVTARAAEIRARFAEIDEVREARIARDRRHRARIDRARTLRRARP